ncbi:MAG: DNA/RNA non-specific endonuclease [Eubacterium sp.]
MKNILAAKMAAIILVVSVSVAMPTYAAQYDEGIDGFCYNGYNIPAYDGDSYEIINDGEPMFTSSQLTQDIYEEYGELDDKGRVTQCIANIDQTLMPTEERGSISSVYPTGWVQKKYDIVSGGYLYNRSHLIGWQLTGENANKNNLMTGTRSFNTVGMLPFENQVAEYIRSDEENNVLYRVTPVFLGENLLASGVIMEAESVDDLGESIKFCVFVYNVQQGVSIDYSTGDSVLTAQPQPRDIAKATITVASSTYTGTARNPAVTVKFDNKLLTRGTDYTLYYTDNINAGTAHVEITGINDFTGSVTKSFIIKKATYTPTVSSVKCVYDGKPHYISIKGIKSGSTIKYRTSSTSYSAKKVSRTSVGKTTVYYSISNPNYASVSGSRTITVLPRSTSLSGISAGSGRFTAKWYKRTAQTTGYQLQYSTGSSFSSPHTVTIKGTSTLSRTVKNLKHKKRYYVRVRTYKTVGDKNYYSSWSAVKSVVTK